MRTPAPVLAAVLAALLAGLPAAQAQDKQPQRESGAAGAAPTAVASVAGTTWAGTDSDGDYYEYTFLPGGQLRYATRQSGGGMKVYEDVGDHWAQNGTFIVFTTNKFTTRQGQISGNRMQGDAWNVRGDRWTWLGDRR